MHHDVYPASVSTVRDALAIWLDFASALRRSEATGLAAKGLELHRSEGVHDRVGAPQADQDNPDPDVVVLPFSSA
ncbi:hypothetical protein HNR07_002422 [Nocardiopsis metallicus]|uniref:Uncharacterized protein n=1 Tax=Nocardiopsis metallicus TaxID=179819 RepID=A0A840WH94_9ACTN|nr:hypothetical protein [Nocardiopsis metallicus]